MSEHPGESVAVSLPPQSGSNVVGQLQINLPQRSISLPPQRGSNVVGQLPINLPPQSGSNVVGQLAINLPPQSGSNVVGQRSNSLPPQSDSNVVGQQSTITIKTAWSAVMSPLSEIWSPLAYHVGYIASQMKHYLPTRSLLLLVSHLILCMIMTILLPISLPWKLITKGRFTLTWKWLLAASCIAISLDPLFFYIPFIDDKNKCLGMDKKLRAIALALRSLTDLAFALHIEALIHDRIDVPPDHDNNPEDHASKCMDRRKKWLSKNIIIDFIGILPIPQVTILIAFFRMRWSAAIGNVFLLLQFFARGYQIYHLQRQFRMLGKWTTSAFYFFMYIIAGNVLGAFWYILSIQREISCWHQACRNITGCVAINYCEDPSSSTNIMLLNEFCPINPSNATLYDFGVFLGALQSGNTGPISFWTKYFYTFWWGIRNLSNFGTGLETSNYVWENCFTLFVSLVGLLLFIYLMGNVQTYILWESTRALEDQEKKVNAKYQDLEKWLSTNGIPEETKIEVVKIIKQNKVAEKNYGDGLTVDVDLIFVLNAIKGHDGIKLKIQKHFCQNALNKVAILQHLYSKYAWDRLLDVFDPVSYEKDTLVVKKGMPIDKMLIITQGVITCTDNTRTDAATTSMMPKSRFEKGDIYGQELLSMHKDHPTPESTGDVNCETKVEAFTLTADKLKSSHINYMLERAHREALEYRSHNPKKANKAYRGLRTTRSAEKSSEQQKMKMECKENDIMGWLSRNGVPDELQTSVMKHIKANHHVLEKNLDAEVDVKYLFSIGLSWDIEFDIKKHLCMDTLHKVLVLNLVDEDVLHRICMSLEPIIILPNNNHIFNAGDEIDRMLIIVEGKIKLTERTFNRGFGPAPAERAANVETIHKGDFFGEELLISAFPDTSISMSRPAFSNQYVECCTKVEAFALPKKGVESVVAYYRDGIDEFEQLENVRDGVVDTKGESTSTTTIQQNLDQLIKLHSEMVQQQVIIRNEMANQGRMFDDQGRKLDEMAAFLARTLGYPSTPPSPPAA